jgi:hypothetical protein
LSPYIELESTMGHSSSRTFFRYFPFLFAALLWSPAAYARGGHAWIIFSLFIAGLAGLAVVTLLVSAITSLCARKGRRLRAFVITCLAWPAWSLCLFFVVPKFLCNQFFLFVYLCQRYSAGTVALLLAISTVSLWFVLLFYKYRRSEELRPENAA